MNTPEGRTQVEKKAGTILSELEPEVEMPTLEKLNEVFNSVWRC